MSQTIGFFPLLNKVQKHISEKYSASLSQKDKYGQLKSYIDQYLHEKEYEVEGLNFKELSDKLYSEMAEYSLLTKYLDRKDIEEININGWDDIAITYTDGRIEKLNEHFYSPQHSVDIVKRLLHHSGMLIDNMIPIAQGHLPNNTRIAALKTPVVDDDRGISVSIRLLHPARVTKEEIVKENGGLWCAEAESYLLEHAPRL
jgi:pilus assembly protein CpaF